MSISLTSNEQRATSNASFLSPLTFLFVFIVYYLTATPLMDDSDVPWHLATGRLLLETHRVPTTDPWSFATHSQPWYLLSWIWDLFLGITERCFGPLGVLITTLAISAALPAIIAAQLLRMRIALPAIFFTVMIASLSIMDFITARPHLGGYVMALVFYAILYRSREELHYGKLLWLPPLMLIWANMHGSFIAGFSVLGAYAIEAYAAGKKHWLKRLLLISFACALCAAINPYGPDVIFGTMKTLNGAAKQYTLEWMPFSFSASTGISAWLILFILASNMRGSRAAIADKILAVGWLIGTMFAMRNGPIFILLSAPYLATCFDEATADLREIRKPSSFMIYMERQPAKRAWLAVAIAFTLFVSAVNTLPHQNKIISEDLSVSDAIDFAIEHYPTRHYLTDFNFGGQVIYATGGKLSMFMDSRAATAYGEEAMQDYLEFLWQKDGWEEKMAKYGIDAMMIGNRSLFTKAYENGQYHDHWKLVFAGKRANIYLARNSLPR